MGCLDLRRVADLCFNQKPKPWSSSWSSCYLALYVWLKSFLHARTPCRVFHNISLRIPKRLPLTVLSQPGRGTVRVQQSMEIFCLKLTTRVREHLVLTYLPKQRMPITLMQKLRGREFALLKISWGLDYGRQLSVAGLDSKAEWERDNCAEETCLWHLTFPGVCPVTGRSKSNPQYVD
jgi:hypothetical protein